MTASDRFLRDGERGLSLSLYGGGGIASIPKLQWALDGGGYAADLVSGIPVLRSKLYATAALDPYPIAIQVPVLTLGASEFVDLGSDLGLVSGGAALPFSIVAKIKSTAASTRMVVFGNTGSGRGIRLERLSTSKLVFGIYSSTGNRIAITSTADLTTDQEYEVAATYSGSGAESGLKLYIDGELAATASGSGGTLAALTEINMTLGTWNNAYGSGQHSLVKIYSIELTAGQVVSEITSDEIETVAHYVCQEGAGSTIYNVRSNSHHGTITATTPWINFTNTTKDWCVKHGGILSAGFASIPRLVSGSGYANGSAIGSSLSNEFGPNQASLFSLIDWDPFDSPELATICASSPYGALVGVQDTDTPDTKFQRLGSVLQRDRLVSVAAPATGAALDILEQYTGA